MTRAHDHVMAGITVLRILGLLMLVLLLCLMSIMWAFGDPIPSRLHVLALISALAFAGSTAAFVRLDRKWYQ